MRLKMLALLLLLLFFCTPVSGETLPRLELTTPRLNYFVYKDGTLSVTEALGTTETFSVRARYRGSTSAFYEGKRNYRLTLTEEGTPLKRSLLGLRKDDDWLLDGMYGDLSRLRNRMAMELWDSFYRLPWTDASGAIHGSMAELWFDGSYKGLYALNERLDRKQLGLSGEGGRIYKTFNPSMDGVDLTDFEQADLTLPDEESATWYNVELNWKGSEGASWDCFTDFRRFVAEADDDLFAAQVDRYLDLDNCADYYLFINMLGCTDNMCKNMVFCVRDVREDGRLYLIPWDLDACMGRLYDNQPASADVVCTNGLFERLKRLPAFNELLKQRYAELRNGALSPASVRQAMTKYTELYEASGVIEREQERFTVYRNALTGEEIPLSLREEWDYMLTWLEQRYEWLDGIYL